MTKRTYNQLPPIVNNYPLDTYEHGWFGVIIPQARTNIITNPSFETATTDWALEGLGTSIARSAAQQYHGAYSLAVTPSTVTTAGCAYIGVLGFTSGTTYVASAKVRGVAGVPYAISIRDISGNILSRSGFIGTGEWQWVWTFYAETSTTTRRVYITKDGSTSTGIFYVDGVQVEACGTEGVFVTTYIDGDQNGLVPNQFPPAYLWAGTPHASISTRSGQTRAGGRVLKFSSFGFLLTAIIGLGLITPDDAVIPFSFLDGGQYQRTRFGPRQFTLTGQFSGVSPRDIQQKRKGLASLLSRDMIAMPQPLVLEYEAFDQNGVQLSHAGRIVANYKDGLGGNNDNLFAESAPITFTQYLPVITTHDAGATLDTQDSVSNAQYFITRSSTGAWGILGASGANGVVRAIAIAPNGYVYVGGDFTDFGGSGADYIARWDGLAWSAVGSATALNNTVYALAFDPNGTLYVAGAFTNAGGNANADGIATWNGSAWGNLSTGTGAAVLSLAVTGTGTLYAGGQFSSIGTSGADCIAYWNGSVWSNLASDTAINSSVYALAIGLDGKLYVGGAFTNANGIANADYIASWDGASWAALSTGANTDVRALAVGANGLVYAGGGFTTIGGITASHIAQWNGVGWSPLGSGITTDVYTLAFVNNVLYVGGVIATAGGLSVPDGFAVWTGASWVYADVDLPGSPTVYALAGDPAGTLYMAFDTTGTATASGVTTVTNTGTAKAYPTIIFKAVSNATGRIYRITNASTNRTIYFNYTIQDGETLILKLQPDAISFVSTFRGNIISAILPGSNEADFFLQRGENRIAVFTADADTTAVIQWPISYESLDDLVIAP